MSASDSDLVTQILEGGSSRELAIRQIYNNGKAKNAIRKYVLKSGGQNADLEDVFQDAVVIMDRKVREGEFRGESSLTTYLIGIGKFLWLNKNRKNAREFTEDPELMHEKVDKRTPESLNIEAEHIALLHGIINKLGGSCSELLNLWKLSYSMKEIAEKLKLSSAKYARKKKYRCMKRLVALVQESEHFEELYQSYG